jgi:DNA-binding response OmpR family regulator
MMPQMNGFELIKAIRATVKHASLPIIVISSEAQRGETKNLPTETGHCVALQKPVSPENILKAVDYLLR